MRVLSLYVPEACPFVPSMLTIPCSVSIFLRCSLWSSSPSTPISAMMVKIVAYRLVDALIILVTFSVVGIIGVPCSHLYLGLSHGMLLVLANHSYARQKLDLLDSDSFELAITVFTSFGFLRSATLLSCLSRCRKALIVFSAFPSFLALVRVFIISSSYFTGCWGRRIAIGLVGILVPIRLEWFSIPVYRFYIFYLFCGGFFCHAFSPSCKFMICTSNRCMHFVQSWFGLHVGAYLHVNTLSDSVMFTSLIHFLFSSWCEPSDPSVEGGGKILCRMSVRAKIGMVRQYDF